ncbi:MULTISPECIES: DUF4870 domain-containing protein [unclassified Fusibacter]|uniref:DUF4870 domain-containing protein n=1 Tax=unclassified Fusibacter TaxID=2624464 RepID=UPI0019D6FF0D|nr:MULTISPECIES: hypothetical protein [unclassified Fusibacter]MCK8060415.1 hypothetical protein [Fusibacter sp. A2]
MNDEKNKVLAALAYLLFFIPLIACPEDEFAKFHANQGLILFIIVMANSIVMPWIPILGWIAMPIIGIASFVLFIIGIINALNSQKKELPFVGGFKILK